MPSGRTSFASDDESLHEGKVFVKTYRRDLERFFTRDFNIDTAIDQLYGSLYYRLLLASGKIDETFVEETYQQFLTGHKAYFSGRK